MRVVLKMPAFIKFGQTQMQHCLVHGKLMPAGSGRILHTKDGDIITFEEMRIIIYFITWVE